ncbi:hypothetical protein L596_006016 [Steinernema carpocapsae]|uniref:Uncharacterized protein n=1 Tax=Steinernema carpocapsae TaxID=34508 RepID=A0A4U8V0U4_STECR|nr:hypothetical protein L596_006016 [Steinernema carpocapsae]
MQLASTDVMLINGSTITCPFLEQIRPRNRDSFWKFWNADLCSFLPDFVHEYEFTMPIYNFVTMLILASIVTFC